MSKVFSLAFSVLLNSFPTVYIFYNLFHHAPRMISNSFLATATARDYYALAMVGEGSQFSGANELRRKIFYVKN